MEQWAWAGGLDGYWERGIDVAADELDDWLLDDGVAAALLSAATARASTAAATHHTAALPVGDAEDLEVLQGDELGALIFSGEGYVFAVGRDGGLDDQAGAGVDDVDNGVEEADPAAVKEIAILGVGGG